ncbi:hypothetical protein HB770_34975 (plasmid) [Rhizobium leguminosarum bv. viciae]|uniref:Uncharacterized protein n=7 Tax=Rhizobium TaxID=379 RepID=A0A7G6RNA0_RHILV|nr:hypothetical protein HB770_34975 [Rhizobium leguminosarum bv. viciae]
MNRIDPALANREAPDRTAEYEVLAPSSESLGPDRRALMGWKTPKIEYVNGYKIVEVEGPSFKVYDGDRQLGDDFPYPGEAAAYATSLPKRDHPRS